MIRASARLTAAASTSMVLAAFTLQSAAIPFQASSTQAPATGTVVLTGARLIDGTGRAPVEQATLVVSNGRVEAVGPSSAVKPPAGATIINIAGKTMLPGLINAHGHLGAGDKKLPLHDQIVQQLRLYAQYGVTTVQSLGDDGVESVKVHDEQERGVLDRARLYTAGAAVVGDSVDDARQKIDKVAAQRVDIVKTRMNRLAFADGSRTGSPTTFKTVPDMAPDVYRAVIEQAHKHGLRVAAHLFYLDQAKALVDAGLDIVAHGVRDQDVDRALVASLKQKNVGYIPTLTRDVAVYEFEATPAYLSDPFFLRGTAVYRNDLDIVKDAAFQEKVRMSSEAQLTKKAVDQGLRNVRLLSEGGVTIAMGTDSGAVVGRWQGYNEHRELELMVKAGLSPMQSIVAATGGAARVTRLDTLLGTLEPGKWADFLVLNANPLTDIRNTRQIDSVWIAGRRLTPPNAN
jgi:imidazolonepropionase-like amidohydrolase